MGLSLASRLLLSAALWTAAVLTVAGFALSSYYQGLVERGFDQRLHVYLKALVADLASNSNLDKIEFTVGEPRFELPLSGWYWQIGKMENNATNVLRTSPSLFDRNLPFLIDTDPEKDVTATRDTYTTGPDEENLRQVERIIQVGDQRFVVAVAGESSEIAEEVGAFRSDLIITFILLGLGLVATAAIQVLFGLRPLSHISQQIAAIRAGKSERLEGAVPREIAPLARELNGLLDSNREVIARARTHAGNLAHALKTPLSVIVNEANASTDPMAEKVIEQADIMRHQIDHHLDRARVSAGIAVVGAVTEAKPVVEALVRAMEKVHRGRDIRIETAADDVNFRGEQQDLEEMVGNLLDNACKWAAGRVLVSITAEGKKKDAEPSHLQIIVDDDGPGLGEKQREAALRRGRRLDETKPGSGLGLAIVSDLATLYGGSLSLGDAPLGGLRAELKLPEAI
ncbi:ATPase [Terrihabitans soli]|uniref:histidine kinase n=1 Tax=Terrihabitans soli TaxID=708113 RepID=A0A6S6QQP3_9HYPH|nr:ATP-binding protein [Terrihabitans soli]BCJ90287.1 ATPase [Terrihabitans soli]